MNKYTGAIVDHEGYIIFEFTTRFAPTIQDAEQQAWRILDAWKAANPEGKFYFDLDARRTA